MRNYYFILCMLFSLMAKAQKVPDIQTASFPAPVNIRIDGKAGEWGDTFAADNKRTSLQYTMANDDKNLYLVVKAAGTANINKVMLGGITFTVNTEGKKKDKDAMSVTYPLIKRAPRGQGAGRQGGEQISGMSRAGGNFGGGNFGGQNRTPLTTAQRDSASLAQHKTQLATVKEIKVTGFKAISDSLISIYNEYGVKTVASFDNSGAMIYELAIPLNLLDLSSDKNKEFAYQIKVNGMVFSGFGGGGFGGNRGGGEGMVVVGGGPGGGRLGGGGGNNMQDMMSPTDFWGKYTLIKP